MKIKTWQELPPEARDYVRFVEEVAGVPVRFVSVGPERDQVVKVA